MKKQSIKRKIIAALFFSGVLPIFAGIILIYLHTTREFVDTLGESFQRLAQSVAKELDLSIIEDINGLKSISDSLEVKWILKTAHEYLKGMDQLGDSSAYLEKFLSSYIRNVLQKVEVLTESGNGDLLPETDNIIESGLQENEESGETSFDNEKVNKYINNILFSLKNKEKKYLDILITNQAGRLICGTSQYESSILKHKAWWRATYNRGKGEIYVGKIHYEAKLRTYIYDIAIPVFDYETQRIEGIIKVSLDARRIFSVIRNNPPGRADNITLVRGDDKVIVDVFSLPLRKNFDLGSFLYRLDSYSGWKMIYEKYGNQNLLVGFVPVSNFNKLWREKIADKWYVLVSVDKDDVLLPIYILLWQLSIWGGIFVLVLSVLGYFLADKIVKPIKHLQEGTEIIGGGDLYYNLEIKTKDEIEELANKFNLMTQRLRISREKLNAQNEELRRLDKVKTNFLSLVSHELRTPLLIIKESISQVLEGLKGDLNHEQQEFLAIGKRNVGRLNGLIGNLLDVSKIESGHIRINREITELVPIIEEVKREIKEATADKSIVLNLVVEKVPEDVFIDAEKIKQVFRKLIDNALKFTPQKGKVDIVIQDKKDEVVVSVVDSGVGIPPQYLGKIFEKFEKLNLVPVAGVGSIGLGLAIVKEYVELHGGTVKVESQVNKGSTFSVTLPKYYEDRYLIEYLKDQIKVLESSRAPLAIFGFRINEYKKIRNLRGQQFINELFEVLEDQIKQLVEKEVREIIILIPKGEMLVFIAEEAKAAEARVKVFKKVLQDFGIVKEGQMIEINISLATVIFPDEGTSEAMLLKKLEEKLYKETFNIKGAVKPLGRMLLDLNLVTHYQLKLALQRQEEINKPLGQILVEMRLISSRKIGKMLEKQLSLPYINLTRVKINESVLKLIGKDFILKHKIFPLSQQRNVLYVAMVNPFNIEVIDELELLTNYDVRPFIAMEEEFDRVVEKLKKFSL